MPGLAVVASARPFNMLTFYVGSMLDIEAEAFAAYSFELPLAGLSRTRSRGGVYHLDGLMQ